MHSEDLVEKHRLEVVRLFQKIDFSKHKALCELVTLASDICDSPIAMITFMGDKIQWFKCKTGTHIGENTRESTFCQYLLNQDMILVVEDALNDKRFSTNPIVTDLGIRFYAGMPLITEQGDHLGSLCVFDRRPHKFSNKQESLLAILSRQAMHLIELELTLMINTEYINEIKSQKSSINNSAQKLRAFYNSSASMHFLLGKELEIQDFNRVAKIFMRVTLNKTLENGKNILEFIAESFKAEFICGYTGALKGKRTNKEVLVDYQGKGKIWWNVIFRPVIDDQGKILSVAYSAANITESKKHQAEILSQSDSLRAIAFIQSHEYRKPVASILGIMELIKCDNYFADKETLQLMGKAVAELDEKIRSVIRFTEVINSK